MERLAKFWLFLLPLAFLTSMAAMETLSWSFFLIFLAHLSLDIRTKGWSQVLANLKLGIDGAIWGYFFIVCLGALLVVQHGGLDVVGDARWVFLLYAYSYILKSYSHWDWEKYVPVLATVVVITGVVAGVQFFLGWDFTRQRNILEPFGQFYRASGFFNHPLTFAYSIGMVWLVTVSLALREFLKKNFQWPFWMLVAASLAASLAMVTCLSRGAWLAGAISLLLMVFLIRRRWAVVAFMGMLLVAVFLGMTNSTIRDRFQSLTTVSANESNRLRTVLWRANWEIFKDHPIIGVGLSKNRDYLLEYYQRLGLQGESIVSHAHNNYLQILAGTGTLGFLFYLWFSGFFVWQSWRLYRDLSAEDYFYRSLALGVFSAQIFFHIGGFTQCNFTDGEVLHQLVFLWALVLALKSRNRIWFSDPRSYKLQ